MKQIYLLYLLCLIFFGSCTVKKLPSEKFYGLKADLSVEYRGDSLFVEINNFVLCPMRYDVIAEKKETNEVLDLYFPLTMQANTDTTFYIAIPDDLQSPFEKKVLYGDPNLAISNPEMVLPFPLGKTYKIIQGINSDPSHNHDGSRYALDFSLKINDTICAAADGYVVSMIEGYSEGGPLKKWRPYSNQIMTYNSEANVFFIYAHLVKDGSFVEVGDTVKMGQPIALSGLTGYTTIEHLHFDMYKAGHSSNGLISTPYTFKSGVKCGELLRNQKVKRVY